MSIRPVPPVIKYAIIWGSIILTILGGAYIGWSFGSSWGVKTELSVHIDDSKRMLELRKLFIDKTNYLEKKHAEIKNQNMHECGNMRWSDVVRSSQESN